MRPVTWGLLITITVAVTVSVAAQQPLGVGGEMRIVQRRDIAGTNLEVLGAVHTWPARTITNWHTHPGEMVGYVTEGAVVVQRRGERTLTVKAGESFVIAAGVPHTTANDANGGAHMFVTYVVPKDGALSHAVVP